MTWSQWAGTGLSVLAVIVSAMSAQASSQTVADYHRFMADQYRRMGAPPEWATANDKIAARYERRAWPTNKLLKRWRRNVPQGLPK